ncbi:MAG: sigma-70 family RNA polymerase sigma factor [Myxococcaceae bacterium]|nr:sigma-70 family RNA polymerase sigma factor [Myxococcaceae bacterium]
MTPEVEQQVLTALRGDSVAKQHAFRLLFDSLRKSVTATCLHITGGEAEAQDAAQEAFIAIHQALPRFREEAKLSTWALQIAVHVALRTRRRQRADEPIEEAAHVADRGLSPEHGAEGRQLGRRLSLAISKLSAEQRAVLALFAVEGLSQKDIAEILVIPEGTVWSRLHAARKRLQELL